MFSSFKSFPESPDSRIGGRRIVPRIPSAYVPSFEYVPTQVYENEGEWVRKGEGKEKGKEEEGEEVGEEEARALGEFCQVSE